MSDSSTQHLSSHTEQGALILTITEPHLRGYSIAKALRNELLSAISESRSAQVVLDMAGVVSFSSEAFRPLLSVRRHLQEQGGRLILCNLTPTVAAGFSATRMVGSQRSSANAFEIQPDVEAALASLTTE